MESLGKKDTLWVKRDSSIGSRVQHSYKKKQQQRETSSYPPAQLITFCLLGINMVNTINHYREKQGERFDLKTSGKNKLQKKRKIQNAGILEEKAWDHGLRWWKKAKWSRLSDLSLRLSRAEWERENKKERDYLISPSLLPLPKSSR